MFRIMNKKGNSHGTTKVRIGQINVIVYNFTSGACALSVDGKMISKKDKENMEEVSAKNDKIGNYTSTLDNVSLKRYREKLTVNGMSIQDPYSLTNWKSKLTLLPNIEYGDIYNYLINSPGIYTKESMRAYKSLDGYKVK